MRLIITRTDLVNDDKVMAKLDDSLAARIANWHGWSKQRIVNAVDAAVRVADPDAAHERRITAEGDRYIGITAHDNGMAEVYGKVAAAAAAAFDRRLSQLAKQVCPADPRTFDHRRADALAALTESRRRACACGLAECPSRVDVVGSKDGPAATQVVVTVVASEQPSRAGAICLVSWRDTASSMPSRYATWPRRLRCGWRIRKRVPRPHCGISLRRRSSVPSGVET